MLAPLKRLYRLWFPRKKHSLLDSWEWSFDDDARQRVYTASIGEEKKDPFVAARYFEGVRWRGVLRAIAPPPGRVLDVGAGNGAIEHAIAAGGYRAFSIDAEWNPVARALGAKRVIADAAALPFRANAFDVVLMLETVEHLARPGAVAAEVARALADRGVVLVTTPPRWRYALRGDPHFGIRSLVLLPPRLQRAIAARRGFDRPHHYVDRIYGSIPQLARALAPLRVREVWSRSRAPRRWFWDAVILKK